MDSIIEIDGLSKQYGTLTALNNLSLSVNEGEVVGFIGPNGAGKTTTMRILTTLLQPTLGQAWVAGYSVTEQAREVRKVIGYMPDFFGVYEDMKTWEYLDFFAACYDVPINDRQSLMNDLLSLVDLSHKKNEYVENLSRGMKQRLCLARTLAHDPKVLILDEPASGLDPRARIEMRELLRELKNMGKTIFFSSHILSEVADICTNIAILEAGTLVAFGDMAMMKKQLNPHRIIQARVLDGLHNIEELLLKDPRILTVLPLEKENIQPGLVRFEFAGDDLALSELLSDLIQTGLQIVSFHEEDGDLEDVFLKVTRGIIN
jgi:ABC-2 type transport system ATP-binding protein